jgi:uncharacterized protein (TIGR02996 family)
MEKENQAFLDAIIASPEDDTPRLVYADWLDEHGNPDRAEFIRVQIQRSRTSKYDPEWWLLLHRERELLAKNEAEWATPVAAITRHYEFQRGFIHKVAIGGRKLGTHGVELFQLAPIRHVRVVRPGTSGPTLADLAAYEVLPRIRGLTLQGRLDDAGDLRMLFTAPAAKSLSALTLEHPFAVDGLQPLLEGSLPHLESLDLGVGVSILTANHIETLSKARWASKLLHLGLRDHGINVSGVEAIAQSKVFAKLSTLDLNHCGVGLAGTRALAESSTLKNLFRLDLRRNRLTDRAAIALAAGEKLPALTELYLGMNELGPEGAKALANGPGLTRLRLLHLYSNPIGDEGALALAASPHAANIRYLDVSHTGISERGMRALRESPHLKTARIGSFRDDDGIIAAFDMVEN